jgi:ferrochelatase
MAKGWKEEEVVLLFSAHGVPQEFVASGDPYQQECELSYAAIKEAFPRAHSCLCYQSQFGKQPWIQPYTSAVVAKIASYAQGRKKVVIIPLSFTSDHIETLFEIEQLYLPVLREQGVEACRCPALNRNTDWIEVIASLFRDPSEVKTTQALYRRAK